MIGLADTSEAAARSLRELEERAPLATPETFNLSLGARYPRQPRLSRPRFAPHLLPVPAR